MSRPASQKSPTPAPRRVEGKPVSGKSGEFALYALSLALFSGVGYVGWRTQVKGESLESVLPFFATGSDASATAIEAGADPADADAQNFQARPGSQERPVNTFFGRRQTAPAR